MHGTNKQRLVKKYNNLRQNPTRDIYSHRVFHVGQYRSKLSKVKLRGVWKGMDKVAATATRA